MKTITIGILFIGCLAINILIRNVLTNVRSNTGILALIKKVFSWLELGFWIAFIFWVSTIIEPQYQQFLQLALFFMVVVMLFWYFVRDYIVGIQLKSRYSFTAGQAFSTEQTRGVIKKVKLLYIEIKSDSGGDLKIPYSQIDQKSLELNVQEKGSGESLIRVELDARLNETNTAQKITELIINSPWCSYKTTPIVSISEEKNGQKTYEISCILVGENGGKYIRELIENQLGNKKNYLKKQS